MTMNDSWATTSSAHGPDRGVPPCRTRNTSFAYRANMRSYAARRFSSCFREFDEFLVGIVPPGPSSSPPSLDFPREIANLSPVPERAACPPCDALPWNSHPVGHQWKAAGELGLLVTPVGRLRPGRVRAPYGRHDPNVGTLFARAITTNREGSSIPVTSFSSRPSARTATTPSARGRSHRAYDERGHLRCPGAPPPPRRSRAGRCLDDTTDPPTRTARRRLPTGAAAGAAVPPLFPARRSIDPSRGGADGRRPQVGLDSLYVCDRPEARSKDTPRAGLKTGRWTPDLQEVRQAGRRPEAAFVPAAA